MRMESFFSPFFFEKRKKKFLMCLMSSRVCVCCVLLFYYFMFTLRAQPLARGFIYTYFTHRVSSKIQQLSLSRVHWLRIRVLMRARVSISFSKWYLKLHAAKVFFLATRSASSVSFSNHGILVDAVEAGVALRHHAGWFCGTVIATSFALGR